MQDWRKLYETPPESGVLFYNEKVMDHFRHPRNVGEIPEADGVALVGDPRCGDHIRLYIKVKDDRITELRYKVFGCAAAIATTSILSELAIGRRIEEALEITDDEVIKAAGGIPSGKAHCSLLGVVGLHYAISDYLRRKGEGNSGDKR
ncbi:MAG: iron-sulfur cluster assembly scaffold protein [Deltaproteobacteria bacterium]|mgnify:FL=1|nr:MAG: iron-sulfur cluster assembly scaffold protein [Deltaproteobacteria bacterium]